MLKLGKKMYELQIKVKYTNTCLINIISKQTFKN